MKKHLCLVDVSNYPATNLINNIVDEAISEYDVISIITTRSTIKVGIESNKIRYATIDRTKLTKALNHPIIPQSYAYEILLEALRPVPARPSKVIHLDDSELGDAIVSYIDGRDIIGTALGADGERIHSNEWCKIRGGQNASTVFSQRELIANACRTSQDAKLNPLGKFKNPEILRQMKSKGCSNVVYVDARSFADDKVFAQRIADDFYCNLKALPVLVQLDYQDRHADEISVDFNREFPVLCVDWCQLVDNLGPSQMVITRNTSLAQSLDTCHQRVALVLNTELSPILSTPGSMIVRPQNLNAHQRVSDLLRETELSRGLSIVGVTQELESSHNAQDFSRWVTKTITNSFVKRTELRNTWTREYDSAVINVLVDQLKKDAKTLLQLIRQTEEAKRIHSVTPQLIASVDNLFVSNTPADVMRIVKELYFDKIERALVTRAPAEALTLMQQQLFAFKDELKRIVNFMELFSSKTTTNVEAQV